jgi:hypothetical protein
VKKPEIKTLFENATATASYIAAALRPVVFWVLTIPLLCGCLLLATSLGIVLRLFGSYNFGQKTCACIRTVPEGDAAACTGATIISASSKPA